MGIFDALTNAVTGLRAQSYALENISGNIANSQTTGFKRIDTSFEDLIPDTSVTQQKAGSVMATSRATNTVQGDVQTMTTGTFMAINGDGFFTVEKPSGFVDNNPVFDGNDLYTRRGDFTLNANGYMVNGAGYYLMGQPIDPSTNNPSGSVPQTLQFSNDLLPAVATTQIQYRANLPTYPQTQDADTTVPNSELLDPTGYTVNPLVAGTGTVVGADVDTFVKQSISGGAINGYDASGASADVQLRWAKTGNTSAGGSDTWELFYQADSTATGNDVAWQNAGVSFSFDASGKMTPAVNSATLNNLTVDGTSLGNVNLQFGSGGITQFAEGSVVKVNTITQNGFAAGSLQSVSVNDTGRIVGAYSNGRTIDLAQIGLATFNGEDFLKRMDGGTFAATDESGAAHFGDGGQIVGSALEASNTDISEEFSKLIVTQQAYSANTRIVTTSNEMLQDVMNMIR